jgi:HEAT repeat protein
MRSIILPAVLILVGCGTRQEEDPNAQNSPDAAAIDEIGGTSVEEREQRIRQWLAKGPLTRWYDGALDEPFVEHDEWIGEGKAIPNAEAILRMLLSRRDEEIFLPTAIQALGDLGNAESVPALIDCLSVDGDGEFRSQTVISLGKLRDERAVQPLGKLLQVEPDEETRAHIVRALSSIGGVDAITYVQAAVEDKCGFVSACAKDELAAKGLRKPEEETPEDQVRRWLIRNSTVLVITASPSSIAPRPCDWDDWIAEGRKIPKAESVLRTLLLNRDSLAELPLVALALGDLGNAESVPALIDCLSVDEVFCDHERIWGNARPVAPDRVGVARGRAFYLRMNAAIALGRLRDTRAIEPLGQRLAVESDINVRANTVIALAAIDGPDARAYLEKATKDEDTWVAKIAKERLESPPRPVQK